MIQVKRPIELTQEEYDRCIELSYGDDGYMCEELDRAMGETGGGRYSRALLYTEDDNIIAWLLMIPVYGQSRYEVHIFVDEDHRRRGIGTILLKMTETWGRYKPYVYLDSDNKPFFERNTNLWTP